MITTEKANAILENMAKVTEWLKSEEIYDMVVTFDRLSSDSIEYELATQNFYKIICARMQLESVVEFYKQRMETVGLPYDK